MTKKVINTGTSANSKTGDSLRTAFTKINDNFTEVYNNISGNTASVDWGHIAAHIVPNADNTYNLGSPSRRWNHVYVGPGSITIGDTVLSLSNGKLSSSTGFNLTNASTAPTATSAEKLTNGDHNVTLGSDGYLTMESLYLQGYLKGVDGSTGTTGQVLTRQSNGGVAWANASGTSDRLVNGDAVVELINDGGVIGVLFPAQSTTRLGIQGSELGANPNPGQTDPAPLILSSFNNDIIISPNAQGPVYPWRFKPAGTIELPIPNLNVFTMTLSPDNFVPRDDRSSITLTGSAWVLHGQYSADVFGGIELHVDNIFPKPSNPGYVSGDQFTFSAQTHQLYGYNLVLTLNNVAHPGPAGWTASLEFSAPPRLGSALYSQGAIDISTVNGIQRSAFCYIGNTGQFIAYDDAPNIQDIQPGWTVEIADVTYTVAGFPTGYPAGQYRINVPGATFLSNVTYVFKHPKNHWVFSTSGQLKLPDGSILADGFINGAPGLAGGIANGGSGNQQVFAQGDGVYVQTSLDDAGSSYSSWKFGLDGNLTVPGESAIKPNAGNLSISVGTTTLADLETDYLNSLETLINLFTSLSSSPGYPWSITLPLSYRSYDQIISLPMGTITGTGSDALAPTAHAVMVAYDTWQEACDEERLMVNVGSRTWQFRGDGNIKFPTSINSPVGQTTQSFGMGNLFAWQDGNSWTIATGNTATGAFGETGIGISPGIESYALLYLPSDNDITNGGVVTLGNFASNGRVQIQTNNKAWVFGPDGGLTLPVVPTNNRTGTAEALLFEKSGNQKSISTQSGTAGSQTVERLVIAGGDSYFNNDIGAWQGEGGDIYLWAGRGANGGDIKVDAGNALGAHSYDEGGTIKVRGGSSTNGVGGFVDIFAGSSDALHGGAININAGNGFVNGGDVNITAGQGSTQSGRVTLNTPNRQWVFAPDGTLNLPESDLSHISVVQSTNNIRLTANTNNWMFGTDGHLTFPDNTVQTTAYTGQSTSGVSFVQLDDGSLQAEATGVAVATLTSSLTSGKPNWLTDTPRSLDRSMIDFQYGFDGDGMWFTGNNEETLQNQPAYPIHTTASFPADSQVVVEFDITLGASGEEDWGVCVYPANGIPHWDWGPHPSRIAAMVDCSTGEGPYITTRIHGLTNSSQGGDTSDVGRARFTYNPLAEITILEVLNVDGQVTSRTELPGRLAKDQDYMIGFDADWDNAGPGERSYFTNLSITVGDTGVTKTTELTLKGEVKLPSTVKGFINMEGLWSNNEDNIKFHTVTTHDGFAYIGGETNLADQNRTRINKYSLTTGELVWSKVLGAGRNAQFNFSWTGGVYTLDGISNNGEDYQVGNILYIAGGVFSGDDVINRVVITVTGVGDLGDITTATISGTAPSGSGTASDISEYRNDARGWPLSIDYDTVNDEVVVLTQQSDLGNTTDYFLDQAGIIRINPVSGDVVDNVTLTDEGDIYPYDVAVHPTTGATAVVGSKLNEYRNFGTLTMLRKGDGYFDILKSNLDSEYWPGNQVPSDPTYNFLISGRGIATTHSVDNVNYYEGVSGTTRQGYGALLSIATNGDGTYSFAYASPTGYNYRPGHKIKILGTSLGGATPANDAIVTVNSVDEENGIGSASITGTSANASGTPFAYENVSGTAYNVGSGLTLNIDVDTLTGSRIANINQAGSNYADGDVIIIAGTQFANGATPANDVAVTVVGVDGGGAVQAIATAGTTPTNAIRILVNNVDFRDGNGAVTAVANWNGQGGWNQGYYTGIATTGGTGTGLTVNVAAGGGGYINISAISIANPGTGYTTGDVITINNENNLPGTFTITANGVGSWTMKQALDGEAFVWTPSWNKSIGGGTWDQFESVVYSKDGNSIYAVGSGYYEVSYQQSLVVKFATSDGTIGFSKYLNSNTNQSIATGVATIGNSDIVVSGYEYNVIDGINRDQQFVARLTSGGAVVWKKFYGDGNWGNNLDNHSDIQVDSDDNIYVTMGLGPDINNGTWSSNGFTVTKLDKDGNKLWSRCVYSSNASYLGDSYGNRWSSLHNGQLIAVGRTYVTADDYYNGLLVSMPTDGFAYLGGENSFVQMGAFRIGEGRIVDGVRTLLVGNTFTPSVQPPNITAVAALRNYLTRDSGNTFSQYLHKMEDAKQGGLLFGDGTRQTTAGDRIPQIRGDNNHVITENDSGKHIYFRKNNGTVTIPGWWYVNLPVGFTFTIVNRTGNTCYVRLESGFPFDTGTILGAGRNLSYNTWGIPDSGSGSMVTLIKLENGQFYNNNGWQVGQEWMISGPSDIYIDD